MIDLLIGATIGLHLGSMHFPAKDFNNVNPGIYIKTENNYVAGGYYNSIRKPSFYLGKNFEYKMFSLTVGGVTGYDRLPITPLILPSVKLGDVRITVVPPVAGISAVVHVSYEWKL